MKKEAERKQKGGIARSRVILKAAFLTLLLTSCFLLPASSVVLAQTQSNEDITSSNFRLTNCDGPGFGSGVSNPDVPTYGPDGKPNGTRPYVVCNFGTAMQEIQHLINIMIIVGVLAAIVGFCYAGFLYVTRGSEPGARSEASSVFRKVFIGFIIMLTAWFVVYQLLSWLECGTGSTNCQAAGTSLLGNP